MIYGILIVVHILIAALLITVVLMQSGRGGGLSGAFGGGGGGQTLFGGRGATTFLTKMTWFLGAAFMVTSLLLALTIGRRVGIAEERSVLRENPIEAPATSQPMAPGRSEPSGSEVPLMETPAGQQAPLPSGELPARPSGKGETPSGSESPTGSGR